MRLRYITNITLAGIILSVLAFTIGMAGAIENGTANETPAVTPTVNVTGTPTATLTATPTVTATPQVDDNQTDESDDENQDLIGPGHLLYRLKIAFENMGETFTYNSSEKLGKQVSNARHRINEYRKALKQNDMKAADRALAQYEEKMNQVNASMAGLSDNDTGYINARQKILKHQLILENLSISHPDNKGLQRAYKNTKKLEEKFDAKIGKKLEKLDVNSTKEDREIQKAEKTEVSKKDSKTEKGSKKSN